MPRSFLIKKHSKVTGVVNADEMVAFYNQSDDEEISNPIKTEINNNNNDSNSSVKSSSGSPTSVIVNSRQQAYGGSRNASLPYQDNRLSRHERHDDVPVVFKTKKMLALVDLPVVNNYDDKAYDLSVKRSSSPLSPSISAASSPEDLMKRSPIHHHQQSPSPTHHRVSVVTGPSPPPTPPSCSEKSITPPPGVAMLSSKLNNGTPNGQRNLLLKAELEAPPTWHRPQPFPPYLPFNFPGIYTPFPGHPAHRNVLGHPVYQAAISPNSEPQHYVPASKYFPASSSNHHLMQLSPPRSLGSNSNNPTIVRPEAHHPTVHHQPISPRVPSPGVGGYYSTSNPGHYLGGRLTVSYNDVGPPAFCSTTPPWSSSEEKTQTSPCPSSDSDSGRENAMVTSSLPDSKSPRRKPTTFASPVNGNSNTNESPRYQCGDCNKNYSTYSGLSKHRQFHCAQTQTKKSFSCKYCEKVYVSLGALKMHIRTHTLPCKCKLCGKAFSRPWLLQGHIRTHTGEKPFACQHCSRAFADRSNLRAHLQTHSDVKKYSCKACSKTFSRMSLLLKHEDGGCVAAQR